MIGASQSDVELSAAKGVRAIGGSADLAAAAAHIPSHATFAERCDSGITSPFGQLASPISSEIQP
ncbi:hypothetical protein ACSBOB_12970 [Mesorhizobium sp. ASY16-5R]|uniref:hypothetical protein n=1 Tax=Mesorhizobium sp. ASY16-5R TaxID=3445772 RepID=UPI003FA11167